MTTSRPSPPRNPGDEYPYAAWTGISGDRFYRNAPGADFTTVTNEWLDEHIRSKGPLGKLYPKFLFIMEGDTPSFLNLIDNGLGAWHRPDWGGWGGRYLYRQPHAEPQAIWTQGGDAFSRVTSQDTVLGIDGHEYTSDQATIWRWRTAFQNDFAARMAWTVEDFQHANHNPVLEVNGDAGTAPIFLDAVVGQPVMLDASRSHDPDAGQTLHFHWVSTTGRRVPPAQTSPRLKLQMPIHSKQPSRPPRSAANALAETAAQHHAMGKGNGVAHIILAVTDDGSPQLTSYRRVILQVHPKTP